MNAKPRTLKQVPEFIPKMEWLLKYQPITSLLIFFKERVHDMADRGRNSRISYPQGAGRGPIAISTISNNLAVNN